MRNSFLRGLFILPLLLFMLSCSKIDWNNVWHGGNKSHQCDVSAFTMSVDPVPSFPFLFQKKYDPSGKNIKEINCSFPNLVYPFPDSLPHYRLRLEYKSQKIFFIRMEAPFDTVVTAYLNAQGRVVRTISRNEILENKFEYRNNRLFSVTYRTNEWGMTDTCVYDSYGNILSIARMESEGRHGYLYDYDYSRKAKQQIYIEYTRSFNNDFTLMQYMGFFPELNPVHLRTRSRFGQENVYMFREDIVNHKLDAQGKMTGYDITSPGDPQLIVTHISIKWNCK